MESLSKQEVSVLVGASKNSASKDRAKESKEFILTRNNTITQWRLTILNGESEGNVRWSTRQLGWSSEWPKPLETDCDKV